MINREDEDGLRVQMIRSGSAEAAEWDQFVSKAPSVHVEQLSDWGEIRRLDGWTPTILTVTRDGGIVAGASVLTRPVGRFFSVGYVSRGPIVMDGKNDQNAIVSRRVLVALKQFAHDRRLLVLVVDPPYMTTTGAAAFENAGFTPHLPQLPPTGLMRGTLLIDLRPTEQELLAAMRRSTRQVIGKALQSGLSVRRGGEADIDVLWHLMEELCRRRGVGSNVSGPGILRAMWKRLAPQGAVRIDLIDYGTQPIAALMTICLGRWAIPWRIGWSGAEAKLSPEKALYWSVMKSVRGTECTTFDFNWIDPDEAVKIRRGESLSNSGLAGVTQYKLGFGGEVLTLEPPMDYFPNPILRASIRRVGGRLAGSLFVRSMIRRLSGRR